MNPREWALIIFTILAQMSVGGFLVMRVVHFYAVRKAGAVEADRLIDRATLAMILILGLGLFASLFHLGDPLSSPRAITHVATSWLSREILLGVGFGVLGLVSAGMQWFKVGSFGVRNAVAWLASLVGLVLVYSMARVYMLPTQPGWNTLATPVSFYTTSLLLGSLALAVAFFINYMIVKRKNPECTDCQFGMLKSVLSWLSVVAIVMLGVEFVIIPVYLATLAIGGGAGLGTVDLMVGTFSVVLALRLALAFIGAGILGLFLFQSAKQGDRLSKLGVITCSAFTLVLAAEVLGRFLFYATQVGVGTGLF